MNDRISVSMIVKNEEKMIERCLESVKSADEIVIIDTGSTDKTIEIAKKYTDKVYFGDEYLWQKDFAFHRNQSLDKCTGDWVLIIDADEILEDNGIERLREFISKTDKSAIYFKTISSNVDNTYNINIRAFKRLPEYIWKGPAHNYLTIPIDQIDESDIVITYDYSPSHALDPDRTLNILEEYVNNNPDCVREKYYLAREYYYKKRLDDALNMFNEYLMVSENIPEIADSYMLAAYCYFNKGNFLDARDCCIKAIMTNPDFKEPFILMGKLSGPGNNEKWLEFSELCNNTNVLFIRTASFDKKTELGVEYYNNIYKQPYDTSRYENIYKSVKDVINSGSVLDIGCGTGGLSKYFEADKYQGFDFSTSAIETANKNFDDKVFYIGDVYNKDNYLHADWYVMLEILEHIDDLKVFDNIPKGQNIIFTVPSFGDVAHLRTYDEKYMKDRYTDLIEIQDIKRFNWDFDNNCWSLDCKESIEYILLIKAIKK